MNAKKMLAILPFLGILIILAACSPVEDIQINVTPDEMHYSGDKVIQIEEEFVTSFPNRHSGTEANRAATEWLYNQFTALGLQCAIDPWETINYSVPVTYRNVVCQLPGRDATDPRELVIIAHHDQAPTTIQGADNDGSGIAILLHLAEIFAAEAPPRYTMTFIATDAEEYGMLGSKHYMDTHPNPENIIAGLSIDNLGRYYYDRMVLDNRGQFRNYGPIWLDLVARDAATAAGMQWAVIPPVLLDQVLHQAIPISFTDQGPLVARGVPGVGIAAGYPAEFGDEHYNRWHDPSDAMDSQSAQSLNQSEGITEALIRQLLSMEEFPAEFGPYLYFDNGQMLNRAPLFLIFIGFVSLFFIGSFIVVRNHLARDTDAWRGAFVHYLGFLLPLIASLLFLYLMVPLGLLEKYDLYPATTKDPAIFNVSWSAILVLLVAMVFFFGVGQIISRRLMKDQARPDFSQVKALGLFILGLCGVYVVIQNPFSLLFFVPLLFWFLISGKRGLWKIWDVAVFLLGGLMVYALVYFFGFVILRYNWYFLWFFLNMFSTGTISFGALVISLIILASGLSMLVTPAGITMSEPAHTAVEGLQPSSPFEASR